MKRIHIFAAIALCALSIIGCSGSESRVQSADQSSLSLSSAPSSARLQGKGPIEALALANAWKGTTVTSYVTPESINFEFPGGSKTSVALPKDQMVVAIAPYVDKTHPCETHYMSGCQGELVGVPINVVARTADGTILVDGTMPTMANGFIELWLPRGHEISISMAAKGKSVEGIIGTFANSNTCITTLKLM